MAVRVEVFSVPRVRKKPALLDRLRVSGKYFSSKTRRKLPQRLIDESQREGDASGQVDENMAVDDGLMLLGNGGEGRDEEDDRSGVGVRPAGLPGGDVDVETLPLGHTSHSNGDADGEEIQTFAYIHFREDYHRTFRPSPSHPRDPRLTGAFEYSVSREADVEEGDDRWAGGGRQGGMVEWRGGEEVVGSGAISGRDLHLLLLSMCRFVVLDDGTRDCIGK